MIDLGPQNQLYAVVTGPNTAPPNLSSLLHIGGFRAEQALWGAHEIPENGLSLGSLDMMMLINIDSESLSSGQRRALLHWVEGGGHLIVGGGPSALERRRALVESVAAGAGRQPIRWMTWARWPEFAGDERQPCAARDHHNFGSAARRRPEVLVEQDGLPLLLRREIGAGLVDYLAADPTLEPLASWERLDELVAEAAGDAGAASLPGARASPSPPGAPTRSPICRALTCCRRCKRSASFSAPISC